ncbi:MAG: hypothetical protein Q4P08_01410 [Eubacteriales bacterium]|nr:hypothetical protein [Eubacteriales bacterium]
MKKIKMILILLLLFSLSACTQLELSPTDALSEDISVSQSHQEEEANLDGREDMQDELGQAGQSEAIQAENIKVDEFLLIEELQNLHSEREGFPYLEVTAAYGDKICFTKGAIPAVSLYGTVDGSYQYNLKTAELVADIEDEPTQRVMKIVLRDQLRYILKIDLENKNFTGRKTLH